MMLDAGELAQALEALVAAVDAIRSAAQVGDPIAVRDNAQAAGGAADAIVDLAEAESRARARLLP